MNRFILNMTRLKMLTFGQQFRQTLYQVYAHEALIDVDDLRHNAHCFVFDVDVYRIGKIKLKNLAFRKLLNPFKALEFLIILPLDMLPIIFNKLGYLIFNKKLKFVGAVIITFSHLINFITLFATGTAQLFLAPVRKIIRPAIELALTQPKTFLAVTAIAFVAAAVVGALAFTGVIPAALIGTAVLMKVAAMLTTAVCAWVTALKFQNTTSAYMGAIERAQNRPQTENQNIIIFKKGNTEKITEYLHAINPTLTEVTPATQQKTKHSFALFTGTEALFFKRDQSKRVVLNESTVMKLDDYIKAIAPR